MAVELTVGDRRRVQHVIAPASVVQLLAHVGMPLASCGVGLGELNVDLRRRELDLFNHKGTVSPRPDRNLARGVRRWRPGWPGTGPEHEWSVGR